MDCLLECGPAAFHFSKAVQGSDTNPLGANKHKEVFHMSGILGPKGLEYRTRPEFLKDLIWPDARNIKVLQDVEEVNKILQYMNSQTKIIYAKRGADAGLSHNSYIYVDGQKVILTVMGYDGCLRKREYGFWLDERVESMLTGTEIWQEMNRVYYIKPMSKIAQDKEQEEVIKQFDLKKRKRNKMKHSFASIPLTFTKFMRGERRVQATKVKVWCYDMNSCYAAVLRDKIPDFDHPMIDHIVQKGEIGFIPEEGCPLVHEGEFAYIAFPLIDSPFRKWVDDIYEIKRNSPKGSYEREDAKARLVRGIGNYENSNMLMRAYIVNTANEIMQSLIDKNTILCNTDSLHSLVERKDLLIGDGVGQFKLEYVGRVEYKGHDYKQTEKPKEPKKKKYYFDFEELKIKENTKCTTFARTRQLAKQFVVKTIPLSEVISKLSMKGIRV